MLRVFSAESTRLKFEALKTAVAARLVDPVLAMFKSEPSALEAVLVRLFANEPPLVAVVPVEVPEEVVSPDPVVVVVVLMIPFVEDAAAAPAPGILKTVVVPDTEPVDGVNVPVVVEVVEAIGVGFVVTNVTLLLFARLLLLEFVVVLLVEPEVPEVVEFELFVDEEAEEFVPVSFVFEVPSS